jgi:hypothetical protein
MKFSMTGQEKGDLLIQVTTWAVYTIHPVNKQIYLVKIHQLWVDQR